MRKFIMAVLAALVVAAFAAGPAAATSPDTRGQPNKSCEVPGSSEPPGFTDSAGFVNAQSHYADPSRLPSTANGHAVSQYDVACFQLTSHSG
jgi:hypothetical protein